MLNLVLDSWLDAAADPHRRAAIQALMQQLAEHWQGSDPLLVQLHDQHPADATTSVLTQLAQAGWPDARIHLHSWTAIPGLHPQHPRNQILRSHAAAWHGAQVDLHIASWPQPVQSDLPLPQVLLLLEVGWTPSRARRLKLALQQSSLRRQLNGYSHIAVDPTSPLAQALELRPSGDRVTTIPQLRQALSALPPSTTSQRKRLAWVTPMPPIRSGIATYAATLLPTLRAHYDVTVITDAPDPAQGDQQSTKWLLSNGHRFDRLCYHIGNSPYHHTIQDCARRWPGAVVLHDLYLGDLHFSYEAPHGSPGQPPNQRWLRELYRCHGYHAIHEASQEDGLPLQTLRRYPTNRQVIQRSLGVIVHSRDAEQRLEATRNQTMTTRVPMVTTPRQLPDRQAARERLGLDDATIQICTVGMVGAGKGSLEILHAWAQLPRSVRDRTQLVFAGDNDSHDYGKAFLAEIDALAVGDQVQITGWTDDALYDTYLAGCDFAIQLRTVNRGETSAAAFDVICSGVPAIINANGSMRELPQAALVTVADNFSVDDLCQAMLTLIADRDGYRQRAQAARAQLLAAHAPEAVAAAYQRALEEIYAGHEGCEQQAIQSLAARTRPSHLWDSRLAAAIAGSFKTKPQQRQRQLLVDVTQIAQNDLKTGIQRVVRALVLEWIRNFDDTVRIEPVVLSTEGGIWHYRYAREWTFQLLGYPTPGVKDEVIEVASGDQMLLLDLNGWALVEAHKAGIYNQLADEGVAIAGVVYDILPILHPPYFPAGAEDSHRGWLLAIAEVSEQLICISKAVADETEAYLKTHADPATLPTMRWFHLGADIAQSGASEGWHGEHDALEQQLEHTTSFLMVGTIEPRKGHLQAIQAVSQLLDQGEAVTLVVVGKQGWLVDHVIQALETNPHLGQGIHWLTGISDEYLSHLYATCDCLLAASEAEGFGLPLIEAAMKKMPIVARDIPVFREVAGDAAFYFQGDTAAALADALRTWMGQFAHYQHPKPEQLHWLSWRESAEQLLHHLALAPHSSR